MANINTKLIKKMIIIALVIISAFVFQCFYMISYVPTGSMEPTIMSGSLVLSKKNVSNYKIGDIAIYQGDDMKIIHRIVDIQTEDGKKVYQFKGDNNEEADSELVSKNKIISKYVWHSAILGKVYYYGKTLILAIGMIAGIYFIYDTAKDSDSDDSLYDED